MGLRSCAQGGFVPLGYHCSVGEWGCPSCPRTQHEVGCPWAPDTRGAIPGPALLPAPSHNLHPAACGPRVHGPPLSHPSWSTLPHLLAETLRPMRAPVGLGDTAGAGWGRAVVLPGLTGCPRPPTPVPEIVAVVHLEGRAAFPRVMFHTWVLDRVVCRVPWALGVRVLLICDL